MICLFFGDPFLSIALGQYLFMVVKLQALDIPVALFQHSAVCRDSTSFSFLLDTLVCKYPRYLCGFFAQKLAASSG